MVSGRLYRLYVQYSQGAVLDLQRPSGLEPVYDSVRHKPKRFWGDDMALLVADSLPLRVGLLVEMGH